ncbi:MAG: hypothetical protein AVDCRST_MAG49-3502 [uncultured Thermomicrobiales bacterium]|uniref:Uncharacterized protein n=1 Tax=uncultured Thermomicrobiales bacterium TaxID=1645740 RepID=A0A6J4V701_9BACT|nr:MAG: hypothetical protein AVDCRST_MAG49-3502 [uncultured Thermomicrobiales bacterium]
MIDRRLDWARHADAVRCDHRGDGWVALVADGGDRTGVVRGPLVFRTRPDGLVEWVFVPDRTPEEVYADLVAEMDARP